MTRFFTALAGVAMLVAPAARGNEIQQDLRRQFRDSVTLVAQLMVDENLTKLVVGEFFPPTDPPKTGYGSGARAAFVTEFEEVVKGKPFADKKLGIVEESGDLNLEAKMNYKVLSSDGKEPAVIEVKFTINRSKGNFTKTAHLLEKLSQNDATVIGKPEAVQVILAQTGRLDPTATNEEKKKAIETLATGGGKSPVDIEKGTRVRAVPGSRYSVEILVVEEKDAPKTLDGWAAVEKAHPVTQSGNAKHPFIDLKPGQVYAIRIHNDSDFDAAVEVSIDGVDVFHFVDDALKQNGKPIYPYYIVPRKAEGGLGIIPGWHKDNATSYSFVTREYGKGATHKIRTARPQQNGVISVRFAGAWKVGEEPTPEIKDGKSGKLETDKGPEVSTKFETVTRYAGPFRETISIRYSH